MEKANGVGGLSVISCQLSVEEKGVVSGEKGNR